MGQIDSDIAIPVLTEALEDSSEIVRTAVVYAMGQIDSDIAVPVLTEALKDSSETVRIAAAHSLSQICPVNKAAVLTLIEVLSGQSSAARREAIAALECSQIPPEALEPLSNAFRNEDKDVREIAAQAISRIALNTGADIAILSEMLRDESWTIQQSVAKALSKYGVEAVPIFIEVLRDEDTDVYARSHILEVLAQMEDLSQITDNFAEVATQTLAEFTLAGGSACWDGGAEALGRIGSSQAVSVLTEALFNESLYPCTDNIALAIAQIGGPTAISTLTEALNEANSGSLRLSVAESLSPLGAPAIPILTELLEDEDDSIRWNAVESLGDIGSDAVVQALTQALQDDYEFVRTEAVDALTKIDSPEAISALILALQDEEEYVRSKAAEALGRIDDPEVTAALSQMIKTSHGEGYAHITAVKSLGEIGSSDAIAILTEALLNQDEEIQISAALPLAETGSEAQAAIPILVDALEDEHQASVHPYFAIALAKIAPEPLDIFPNLISLLIDSYQDGDWSIRSSAADALVNLNIDSIPYLIKALHDKQYAAIRILSRIGPDAREAIPQLLKIIVNEQNTDLGSVFAALEAIEAINSTTFERYEPIYVEDIESKLDLPENQGYYASDYLDSTFIYQGTAYDYGTVFVGCPLCSPGSAVYAEARNTIQSNPPTICWIPRIQAILWRCRQ